MNKFTTGFLFLSIILFLGMGCSSQNNNTTTTSTEPAVLKAPASALNLQRKALEPSPAEKICESRGFTIITRFDTTRETSVKYCQFTDGTECLLEEYVNGICGPGQGARHLSNPDLQPNPIVELTCDINAPPVCGANGHSYLNRCIAVQTGVDVVHEGMCTPEEIANAVAAQERISSSRNTAVDNARDFVSNNTESSPVPPPAHNDPAVATQGNNPEWITSVIALIEADAPTDPAMYITACTYQRTLVYYEGNGTDEVVSTLYSDDGTVICNPNRDFANICPVTFSPNSSNCKRIYTDNR